MRIIQSETPRPLNLLAVGPGGLIAAACGVFGTNGGVELWDATTGVRKWAFAVKQWGFVSVWFLTKGPYLLAADLLGASLLSIPQTDEPPDEVARTGWVGAALTAAGERIYVGRAEHSAAALTCWDVPKLNLLWKEDRWDSQTYFGSSPAIDPAGQRLAVAVRVGGSRPGQFVSVRDAGNGEQLARFPFDPASAVQQLAFTADGTKLLVRTDNRKVHLFDAATGAAAGELVHPGRSYVTGVAAHPRGPVACARTNGTVTLWDAATRESLRVLDWKAGRLVSVAFSPDGALGAAGTEDGKVVVWDVDL